MSEKNLGVYSFGDGLNTENFESLYNTQNTDIINFPKNNPAAMNFNVENNYVYNTSKNDNQFEFKMDRTNQNGFWKYEEDKTLKEVEQYLSSTYHSHYTSEQSKTQTLDLIESIGDAEAFTRSNAIKYLSRFGKKNGKTKMDILKAIH